VLALAAPVSAPRPTVDRFDGRAAWAFLVHQVKLGPRPAGSATSRTLAAELKAALPRGSYHPVPGGLRNVVGFVRGRDPSRYVVVAAHYDTKEIPGFVGANDGASGTAVLRQLARTIRPRSARSTLLFVFFDGEESPLGTSDSRFEQRGLRGSRVAARKLHGVDAMVLLDFVGDKNLSLPREATSSTALWGRVRRAAATAGTLRWFPAATGAGILDDHTPFLQRGIPAIDLIDWDFQCFHRPCDNLGAVSERSLDVVGETLVALLERV
jgi:glutaminyl-peptide cyclotransferase